MNERKVNEPVAKTAVTLYQYLAANAKQEEVEGSGTFTVWRGSLLSAFESVSSTRSYYTACWNLLKVANCISILSRGARSAGSVVVLHSVPTVEELREIDPDSLLTDDRAYARLALEAQVKDLLASFRGLDIPKALANLESRIRKLENQQTQ